jgi:hypothetical protein
MHTLSQWYLCADERLTSMVHTWSIAKMHILASRCIRPRRINFSRSYLASIETLIQLAFGELKAYLVSPSRGCPGRAAGSNPTNHNGVFFGRQTWIDGHVKKSRARSPFFRRSSIQYDRGLQPRPEPTITLPPKNQPSSHTTSI